MHHRRREVAPKGAMASLRHPAEVVQRIGR